LAFKIKLSSATTRQQWRSNPLANLAIASGGTFQWAAKSSRLL